MKYAYLLTAFFCLFSITINFAAAQDGEKEDSSAEESSGNGNSGGNEGGGDSASAPAAGGESAPAAAPAAGGESAAAPASAAPAPAPAAAPTPAFDMGAAVQTSAVAPPPATVAAESNPIVQFVTIVSAASGGESFNLSDAAELFTSLGGTQGFKDLAAGESSNIGQFAETIKASVVMVKTAQAKGTNIKEALAKVKTFKEKVLREGKNLNAMVADLAVTTIEQASEADIDLDDPEAFVGTIQIAVASGGDIKEAVKKANNLSDSAKKAAAGQKRENNEQSVKYAGGLDNFDENKFEQAKEAQDKGVSASDLAKTAMVDINGKVVLEFDGDRLVWAKDLENAEFFLVTSADDDSTYSDNPELNRFKISNGKFYSTDSEESSLSIAQFTAASFDFDAPGLSSEADTFTRIKDSVIQFSWVDKIENPTTGEVEDITIKALVKTFKIGDALIPLYIEFGPEWHEGFEDDDMINRDLLTDDLINQFDKATTINEVPKVITDAFGGVEQMLKDFDAGYDIAVFAGGAKEAEALYNTYWDTQRDVLLSDDSGKPVVVTFQKEGEGFFQPYFNRDLEGVSLSRIYIEYGSNKMDLADAPSLTTIKFTSSTALTYVEDGITKTVAYEILVGNGTIKVTFDDGEIQFFVPYTSDYSGYSLASLTFKSADSIDYNILKQFITQRDGVWPAGIEIDNFIFPNDEIAATAYKYYSDNWDLSIYKDSDGDGIADYADVDTPSNKDKPDRNKNGIIDSEEIDTDGDGFIDVVDAFPNDPTEWADADGDGKGDNDDDAFPGDASEWADADGDGKGDNNDDAFPNDATQYADSDGDGYGDNPNGNNPDAFPNDPAYWTASLFGIGPLSKTDSNILSAITKTDTHWSDGDYAELKTYIDNLYTASGIDNVEVANAQRGAIAAAVELMEWVLTDRVISSDDSYDHLTDEEAFKGDGGFKDLNTLNWNLGQVQTMIGLMQKMHAIGDSDEDNKANVQSLLSALSGHSSLEQLLDYSGSGSAVLTQSFGSVLDGFLGTNRGRVDDIQDDRATDLSKPLDLDNDGKGKTRFIDENLHLRVLPGHTNKISGDIGDTDLHVDKVDVTIIASARDTIILDDLTINAPDTAKEDAYIIAAADELYLRGEWSATNHQSMYATPDPLDIEVKNSSLALAAIDEMNLVDVDITTGGSLAIASLDELNIWSTGNYGPNEFTVGTDVGEDDFEGIFLYAQNLIDINGLVITNAGRVDDIYMEAYSINLANVTFPMNASVLLRSENGVPTFLENPGITHGNVNLNNVIHPNVSSKALELTDIPLNSITGAYQSEETSHSGRAYMKVESYK